MDETWESSALDMASDTNFDDVDDLLVRVAAVERAAHYDPAFVAAIERRLARRHRLDVVLPSALFAIAFVVLAPLLLPFVADFLQLLDQGLERSLAVIRWDGSFNLSSLLGASLFNTTTAIVVSVIAGFGTWVVLDLD